jgi:hypothetical protein
LPPSGSADLLASQGGAALREALRDPASIFSGRSPGERAPGALTQSKPRMQPWQPTERVLSPVLDRPGTAGPPAPGAVPEQVAAALAPGGLPAAGGPGAGIVPLPLPGVPGSSGGIIPPSGGGGSSGGGSSGGGSSGGVNPPPPPPVVTPVPEPATWIMMITGIGLIGLQLRRRRGPALAAG